MSVPVPYLDLKAQYHSLKGEIDAEIFSTLESSAFILGPKVAAFEKNFAEWVGAKHCVGLNSGTTANWLSLWALGIGPGDEVIVPAFTFFATASTVALCGATPIFADVDPKTYTLDPADAARKRTARTKAVVPVHLFGHPYDHDAVTAALPGVTIIEDAAQAHGTKYKGKNAGTLAPIACFSFYPGKNLGAYGEGGACTTSDDALAEKVKLLREHGMPRRYEHAMLGINGRLEGIQGAVLGAKLPSLKGWNHRRRQIAHTYHAAFRGLPGVQVPEEASWGESIYHCYVLQLNDRDGFVARASEKKIGTGVHYPKPLHLQPAFAHLNGKAGDHPVSESVAARCVSLPIYPEMTDAQIESVIECVTGWVRKQ